MMSMRESRNFCQRRSKIDNVFFFCLFVFFLFSGVGGSKYHNKRATIGPPAKRHLNDVPLACRWWPNIQSSASLVALWFFRGSGPVLLKHPLFVIFQGGGGVRTQCPPPPLDPRMMSHNAQMQMQPCSIMKVLYGLCVSTSIIHSLKCVRDYLPRNTYKSYNNLHPYSVTSPGWFKQYF